MFTGVGELCQLNARVFVRLSLFFLLSFVFLFFPANSFAQRSVQRSTSAAASSLPQLNLGGGSKNSYELRLSGYQREYQKYLRDHARWQAEVSKINLKNRREENRRFIKSRKQKLKEKKEQKILEEKRIKELMQRERQSVARISKNPTKSAHEYKRTLNSKRDKPNFRIFEKSDKGKERNLVAKKRIASKKEKNKKTKKTRKKSRKIAKKKQSPSFGSSGDILLDDIDPSDLISDIDEEPEEDLPEIKVKPEVKKSKSRNESLWSRLRSVFF